jgi:hypothetical protein
MAIYRAAPGAGFNDSEAQIIGSTLEQLKNFTPRDVVEVARPETSPIHKYFEWDDDKAAEEWRVAQARHLVNRVQIVVKVKDKKITTKAFHSIQIQTGKNTERRYESFKVISRTRQLKDQVIQKALQELIGWKQRYAQYNDVFADLFVAIDEIIPIIESREIRSDRPRIAPIGAEASV